MVIAIGIGVKVLANGKIASCWMLDGGVGHVVCVVIEELVRHI